MVSAKEIRVGEYFKLKSEIFKVVRKEIIAVGTHSHTRSKLIVKSLSSGSEKQQVYSHEDKLDSIEVKNSKGQVVMKTDTTVQVMDLYSYETITCTADPELIAILNEGDTVSYSDIEGKLIVMDKLK
jgi:translation elongation factor P/translation initiation factor 5A